MELQINHTWSDYENREKRKTGRLELVGINRRRNDLKESFVKLIPEAICRTKIEPKYKLRVEKCNGHVFDKMGRRIIIIRSEAKMIDGKMIMGGGIMYGIDNIQFYENNREPRYIYNNAF